MKLCHMIILSVLAIFMAGCNDILNNNSVLVVDLAVVAKDTGRNESINNKIAQAEKNLNEQLKKIAVDLNAQVEAEKKKLTSKSKKKEKTRVAQFTQQAQQTMRNKKAEAQKKINQLKANLLNEFRNDVKAAVQSIAKVARGKVVMATADVLWSDTTVDITDKVIAKMRETK